MKKETLNALKHSIQHWKRLSTGKRKEWESVGADSCALCECFYDDMCLGCPVKDKTGLRGCLGSPYEYANGAKAKYGLDSEEFKTVAKKELKFLRSLLPETKTKKKSL